MAGRFLLRVFFCRWRPYGVQATPAAASLQKHYFCATNTDGESTMLGKRNSNQWLILPPFSPAADGSLIGKKLTSRPCDTTKGTGASMSSMTALKWILKCCPHLPQCLVQKLFRLRQVRKQCSDIKTKEHRARRIGAKDLMDIGDRIFLPKSVDRNCTSAAVDKKRVNEEDLKFVRGLELYKDPAIIVINKPPGMPVQGGLGIQRSLDKLAAQYLKYDQAESPRLVHRLDKDSSGVLVMGRTQLSTTILHSIFREQTFGALNDFPDSKRSLEKKYWALVVGFPRCPEGLISVPLIKVVVDKGKSERITVVDNPRESSSQHAVTRYRVISSSSHGYTWLELSPLTGRKHQLRVHCAEVLGTPIVGDYKYGWQAHKKLGHISDSVSDLRSDRKMSKLEDGTFESESDIGSVSDKLFRLHLHCKEMILPNISLVLEQENMMSDSDIALMESIQIYAPLSAHMQKSWELLN